MTFRCTSEYFAHSNWTLFVNLNIKNNVEMSFFPKCMLRNVLSVPKSRNILLIPSRWAKLFLKLWLLQSIHMHITISKQKKVLQMAKKIFEYWTKTWFPREAEGSAISVHSFLQRYAHNVGTQTPSWPHHWDRSTMENWRWNKETNL